VKKISVRNRQSIKKLDVELSDKITVFYGESQSGKTALMRAVEGFSRNQSGVKQITAGEKESSVKIDGVEWQKGEDLNRYVVGEEVYDKCGRSVPEAVQEVIGIKEIEFGEGLKEILNFHHANGDAFIVEGNGADNAKIIGSISNIHTIYNALREAEKDTKHNKKELNVLGKREEDLLSDVKEKKQQLELVEKDYCKIKEIYERSVEILKTLSKMESLMKRYKKNKQEYEKVRSFIKEVDRVNIEGIEGVLLKREQIYPLWERYKDNRAKLERLRGQIEDLRAFDGEKVSMLIDRYERLKKANKRFYDVMIGIEVMNESVGKYDMELIGLQDEMDKIDVCPECGSAKEHWDI